MNTAPNIQHFPIKLEGAITSAVWQYWDIIRRDRIAPMWAEFELIKLYKEAPFTQVCDVLWEDERLRFRFRFVGTDIVASRFKLKHPDFTGLYFSQVEYPDDPTFIREIMEKCASSLVPISHVEKFDGLDARGDQEHLFLPLVDAKGVIDKLIIVRERLSEIKKYT